jgi:hypothetical protein
VKRQLVLYAVTQHNEPVSSKSPQKELDFKPAQQRAFFSPAPRLAGNWHDAPLPQ